MQDIYSLANKLKEELNNDSRIIRLNSIEKEMNESEEVMKLTYYKDLASDEYSDALSHFSKTDPISQKAQKKLYEAKKQLEEHPLVREYLKAYQEVRILYEDINKLLFSILNRNLCEDK